jgi:hypothetical protein
LGNKSHCVCKKYNSKPKACEGYNKVSEKGKSVELKPKNGEDIKVIIIDGCLITDNNSKCDALFLFDGKRKVSFLVELKGAGEIKKAFKQLKYTSERKEYKDIIKDFNKTNSRKFEEKFVIVSNGILKKQDKEKFENANNIRIHAILYSEATKTIPDLRKLL